MSDNFSDLINNAAMNYSDFITDDHAGNEERIKQIPLKEIRPDPDQVRQKNNHGLYDFDDENSNQGNLKELVNSIKAIGVKQPIVVRPDPDNIDGSSEGPRYMIVIGERRYRACIKAGLSEIPAIIRNYTNVLEVQYDQISENIQRADLTTFEIAFFISKMRQSYLKLYGKKLSFWENL